MQIKKIYFVLALIIMSYAISTEQKNYNKIIVVINPAGDAKRTGRSIDDSFERGLTLQCAEKITTLLTQHYPHVQTIITRLPGDIVYDLQNASLANRINANLFININFYHTLETKPTLFAYQFSYGNDFITQTSELSAQTYDQAYTIHKNTTQLLMNVIMQHLTKNEYQNIFTYSGPHAVPLKPLIGIIAPSIAFEIGLKNKETWQLFVEPLTSAISAAIEELEKYN